MEKGGLNENVWVVSPEVFPFNLDLSHRWLLFLQELSILKNPGEKLGMSIKGGVKNYPGDESTDEGIFISRVSWTSQEEMYMIQRLRSS